MNNSVNQGAYTQAAIVNNNGKQEIYVWGANDFGQLGLGDTNNQLLPTLLDSSKLGNYLSIKELKISLGNGMMAVVNTLEGEQQIYVWGRNDFGQLGIDNNVNQSSPILFNTKLFGDLRIKEINFADNGQEIYYSSYAILSTDTDKDQIYVWGRNEFGQLGLGDLNDRLKPTLFDTTTSFGAYKIISEFKIAQSSYAIIDVDGNTQKLFFWGLNDYGQLGTGDTRKINSPLQSSLTILNNSKIKFLRLGNYKTTFIVLTRNGIDELYSMGYNIYGQLGTGDSTQRLTPFRIAQSTLGGATRIVDINVGSSVFAQVEINGVLNFYAWGYNTNYELGIGFAGGPAAPTIIPRSSLGNFVEVYESSFDSSKYKGMRSFFAYVKTPTGDSLYTWGNNTFGQLGLGSAAGTSPPRTPSQVTTLNLSTAKIKHFSKFSFTSFFLTLDRNGKSESYAVGDNGLGQLGLGNTTNVSSFTPILPTRYTNPQPKIMPTPNLTSSQALELINPNNNLVRTELEKYVDTTSFPASATLSIDPATTTSDYKNGILNLGIRTNQYNKLMIVNPVSGPETFNVTIPGFRPVTDVNTNPVSVIIRDADGNNIDKIYDQLVDSTYKVINRDLLEYYFDLSSI